MSNRNRSKKKKDKGYSSWLAVIFFSLIDLIFSYNTSHLESGVGGETISWFDMSSKLSKEGERKQGILGLVLSNICAIVIAGWFVYSQIDGLKYAWIGAVIFVVMGIILDVIYHFLKD